MINKVVGVGVCLRCQCYLQQMKMKIQCLEEFEPQRAGYRYQKKQTLDKENSKNTPVSRLPLFPGHQKTCP